VQRVMLPDYELEQKLVTNKNGVTYLVLDEIRDEQENMTVFNISVGIRENSEKQNILFTKRNFENFYSRTIQRVFTDYPRVDQMELALYVTEIDNRSAENLTKVSTYTIDRVTYGEINKNWDNLVIRIYDEIEYTPLFLLDFVCTSDVLKLVWGKNAEVTLYYDESYEDFDTTQRIIEKDARNAIDYLFEKFKSVDSLRLVFKAKVPAEDKTVRSGHQILHDYVVFSATRSSFEGIIAENLDSQQYLYNYEQVWNDKAMELNIKENLLESVNKYTYRSFEFTNDDKDVRILIDGCTLIDTNIDEFREIEDVYSLLHSEGETTSSVEEEVGRAMPKVARKLIFNIHPPYLETVTFAYERVLRDTTGNEIEVIDLGSISYEMQEDA